ncbi:hypothetical protein GGF43_003217, partial [Coemansia sp. RSA 2618]
GNRRGFCEPCVWPVVWSRRGPSYGIGAHGAGAVLEAATRQVVVFGAAVLQARRNAGGAGCRRTGRGERHGCGGDPGHAVAGL